jgi:hypothetical protein
MAFGATGMASSGLRISQWKVLSERMEEAMTL